MAAFFFYTILDPTMHRIGAPSITVLCFYGLCYDAMPFPIEKMLQKLKETKKPLSDDHVLAKDVLDLQCEINANPGIELHEKDDHLLTAVLIAFLEELHESLLAPTTATEFVISAG